MYGTFGLAGLSLVYFLVPETEGRTFEEIAAFSCAAYRRVRLERPRPMSEGAYGTGVG